MEDGFQYYHHHQSNVGQSAHNNILASAAIGGTTYSDQTINYIFLTSCYHTMSFSNGTRCEYS